MPAPAGASCGMAKLLMVDDDEDLCIIVGDRLLLDQHQVDSAFTLAQAAEMLRAGKYDLLILDWDLPDGKGTDLCRALRSMGDTIAVLMLTGRGAIDAKEEGFDAGADDYLTKPFDLKELSMRIRALLKRTAASAPPPVKADDAQGPPGVGKLISGKYLLQEVIGEGGMAVVYRATHTAMDKPVVVKMIHRHLLSNSSMVKRFEQECKIMAKISHPNVVAIFDVGEVDGSLPFLVMEYVKGESLYDYIYREGGVPVQEALGIMIQICRGLEAAHASGVIHRDLKPENILIQDDKERSDRVKIVDFGVAHLVTSGQRLTAADQIVGTAQYMAPEQLLDTQLDARADIYAAGIILYEMVSGEMPFDATSTQALFVKLLREQPQPLSERCSRIAAQSPVEQITSRALQKDRSLRFQSAAELRVALERALDG